MNERTFCTTECWDCYDTTCENFIGGLKKDRENRQELRKEIMRLHSIIKEVREYIEKNIVDYITNYDDLREKLLEILDKENKE